MVIVCLLVLINGNFSEANKRKLLWATVLLGLSWMKKVIAHCESFDS